MDKAQKGNGHVLAAVRHTLAKKYTRDSETTSTAPHTARDEGELPGDSIAGDQSNSFILFGMYADLGIYPCICPQ